jgi:hypothetical protein
MESNETDVREMENNQTDAPDMGNFETDVPVMLPMDNSTMNEAMVPTMATKMNEANSTENKPQSPIVTSMGPTMAKSPVAPTTKSGSTATTAMTLTTTKLWWAVVATLAAIAL